MKYFDPITAFIVLTFGTFGTLAGFSAYNQQQKIVFFQQTYNKNLECRQSLKDKSVSIANEICGNVPNIEDFVR